MGGHHLAAALFAVLALPAFVSAQWLAGGRLPLSAGSGMTVRDKAVLDAKLARLLRMMGLALLASAAAMAVWGEDETRVFALVLVMALAVNGLGLAAVLVVAQAKRRARGER